jgi:hypothetical protein
LGGSGSGCGRVVVAKWQWQSGSGSGWVAVDGWQVCGRVASVADSVAVADSGRGWQWQTVAGCGSGKVASVAGWQVLSVCGKVWQGGKCCQYVAKWQCGKCGSGSMAVCQVWQWQCDRVASVAVRIRHNIYVSAYEYTVSKQERERRT